MRAPAREITDARHSQHSGKAKQVWRMGAGKLTKCCFHAREKEEHQNGHTEQACRARRVGKKDDLELQVVSARVETSRLDQSTQLSSRWLSTLVLCLRKLAEKCICARRACLSGASAQGSQHKSSLGGLRRRRDTGRGSEKEGGGFGPCAQMATAGQPPADM